MASLNISVKTGDPRPIFMQIYGDKVALSCLLLNVAYSPRFDGFEVLIMWC